MNEISTRINVINEILEQSDSFIEESVRIKYGETALADTKRVIKAALSIPWYGSDYKVNKSSFTADCKKLFPWISEKAIDNLHSDYASGWIP